MDESTGTKEPLVIPEYDGQSNKIELRKILGYKNLDLVILAIIPLIAYGWLWSYYFSYLRYFGVPSSIISFELPYLLVLLLALSILITLLFLLSGSLYFLFSKFKDDKNGIAFIFSLIWYILLIISLIGVYPREKVGSLVVIGIITVMYVFLYSDLFRREKGESSKLVPRPLTFWDLLLRFEDKINPWSVLILFSLFLTYFLSTLALIGIGNFYAYNKIEYDVLKTNPNCVIIYTLSDKLYCNSSIDWEKKEFEKGYQVYYLDALKGIKIAREEIGPLHPKPTATPTTLPTPTVEPAPTQIPTISP